MTLKPQVCEDEGCPHHGVEHVCVEPRDPMVEPAHSDLLRRSKFGRLNHGATLDRAGLGLRDRLQHAYGEAPDLANYLQCCPIDLDRA